MEYKAEVLAEYDSWPKGSEERGAILRREGLYSSHLAEWRKQAEAGARQGLAAKSKKRRAAEEIELEKLRAKNARLESELARTKTALEITESAHRWNWPTPPSPKASYGPPTAGNSSADSPNHDPRHVLGNKRDSLSTCS